MKILEVSRRFDASSGFSNSRRYKVIRSCDSGDSECPDRPNNFVKIDSDIISKVNFKPNSTLQNQLIR